MASYQQHYNHINHQFTGFKVNYVNDQAYQSFVNQTYLNATYFHQTHPQINQHQIYSNQQMVIPDSYSHTHPYSNPHSYPQQLQPSYQSNHYSYSQPEDLTISRNSSATTLSTDRSNDEGGYINFETDVNYNHMTPPSSSYFNYRTNVSNSPTINQDMRFLNQQPPILRSSSLSSTNNQYSTNHNLATQKTFEWILETKSMSRRTSDQSERKKIKLPSIADIRTFSFKPQLTVEDLTSRRVRSYHSARPFSIGSDYNNSPIRANEYANSGISGGSKETTFIPSKLQEKVNSIASFSHNGFSYIPRSFQTNERSEPSTRSLNKSRIPETSEELVFQQYQPPSTPTETAVTHKKTFTSPSSEKELAKGNKKSKIPPSDQPKATFFPTFQLTKKFLIRNILRDPVLRNKLTETNEPSQEIELSQDDILLLKVYEFFFGYLNLNDEREEFETSYQGSTDDYQLQDEIGHHGTESFWIEEGREDDIFDIQIEFKLDLENDDTNIKNSSSTKPNHEIDSSNSEVSTTEISKEASFKQEKTINISMKVMKLAESDLSKSIILEKLQIQFDEFFLASSETKDDEPKEKKSKKRRSRSVYAKPRWAIGYEDELSVLALKINIT